MYRLSVTTTCVDPESFVREGPTLTTFFFSLMEEELSKYHYKRALFGYGPKLKAGLVAYDSNGIGTSIAKKNPYIFVIFAGRSGPPAPPLDPAHALHPPVRKSRANVLLIFECPGICPTPSQVDIFVSDDSLAFCPTMYIYLGRDHSQMRLVPLNMLKLSSFSFYWRRFRRSSF